MSNIMEQSLSRTTAATFEELALLFPEADPTPEQAAAFVVLADMEDLELWPLITGKRECANSLQAEVVSMLRNVRVKYSSGNAPTSGQA